MSAAIPKGQRQLLLDEPLGVALPLAWRPRVPRLEREVMLLRAALQRLSERHPTMPKERP